jgi:outer membrane protein assembly factor BamB
MNAVSVGGDILWRRSYANAGEVSVMPDGKLIFPATGTNGGQAIIALEPAGNLLWERPLPGPSSGGVAFGIDGTIYAPISAADEQPPALFALRGDDGSIRWEAPIDENIPTSPVVGPDHTIYFGGRNGYLQAFNTNGTRLWITNAGARYMLRPLIDARGVILYGGVDAWAHNPDGALLWHYPFAWGGGGPACIGPDGESRRAI